MTTQTIHVHTFDYGASLTSATLRNLNDDTLVATADTTAEVTADGGLYAIVFDEVSVITAGTYRLRAIVGGQPLQRYVTLAGVDGEVVQAASEPAASIQTATTAALVALSLDSALIAQGAERAVNVDVNHRVHSHVYDMQANTITASALAADAVEEIQSGLATSTCDDRLGYVLAALAGACADAGTAAETYTITIGADTFTIDHTGLDATGNRGTAVLTKS